MSADTLLIEIGTEELPPTSLRTLGESLHSELLVRLDEQRIEHGASRWFASPRRLVRRHHDASATGGVDCHARMAVFGTLCAGWRQ